MGHRDRKARVRPRRANRGRNRGARQKRRERNEAVHKVDSRASSSPYVVASKEGGCPDRSLGFLNGRATIAAGRQTAAQARGFRNALGRRKRHPSLRTMRAQSWREERRQRFLRALCLRDRERQKPGSGAATGRRFHPTRFFENAVARTPSHAVRCATSERPLLRKLPGSSGSLEVEIILVSNWKTSRCS